MTNTGVDDYRVVGEWASALRASDKSEDTIRAYCQAVSSCARHAGKPPLELTSGDVSAWLGRKRLSKNTKAAYYRRLDAWRKWCRQTDRGKLRLLKGIDRGKGQRTDPKPVSEADLARLLLACRTDEELAMVRLGAWMGLRCMEITGVDGEDYDPAARTLRLVGKGGKRKTMPVPLLVAEVADRMPVSGPWFVSERGGQLTRQGMGWRMRVLAKRAGCPEVTLHQLRHRFATLLVEDDQQLFVVQELMRHENAATTKGYVRVNPSKLATAVSRLPEAA